jgi:hypothetical protein
MTFLNERIAGRNCTFEQAGQGKILQDLEYSGKLSALFSPLTSEKQQDRSL